MNIGSTYINKVIYGVLVNKGYLGTNVVYGNENDGAQEQQYTYYVSTSGTGSGVGSISDPLDFTQLQALTPVAGDSIALKGGDEFYGNLTLTGLTGTALNPITYTSYGNGQAVIKGSEVVTGWSTSGGNIWEADVTGKTAYQLIKSGTAKHSARFPDLVSETAMGDNYATITSVSSTTSFICDALKSANGFTGTVNGGNLHIIERSFVLQTISIIGFDNATGLVTLSSAPTTALTIGDLFSITGTQSLLSSQDEWVQDGNTLYMYSTTTPTEIEIATIDDHGISLAASSDYVTIDNLTVKGFNKYGVHSTFCNEVTIKNSNLHYNYDGGVFAEKVGKTITDFTVTNNDFKGGNFGAAIYLNDFTFTDNTLTDIGTPTNMNNSGYSRSEGIYVRDENAVITSNTFDKIGYIGINYNGANSLISNNFISDPNLIKHDGGGIYTYTNGSSGSIVEYNAVIINNDCKGWGTMGIYMDDNSTNNTIRYNNLYNGESNIYIHNANNHTVSFNKCYQVSYASTDYKYNIMVREDAIVGDDNVLLNVIEDNHFFTNQASNTYQGNAWIWSAYDSYQNFGTYDRNIYYSASNLNSIKAQTISGPNRFTLAQWQSDSSQDANSTTNSLWTGGEDSQFVYNETAITKDVTLPAGTWVTLDGNNYEGTINLQPYSSEILIKLVPTYTVSNTDGTADYSSLTTLLATETLVPGDIVALKGGDEFYENITITGISGSSGNPITFTSYGTGKSVIKGSESVTGWTNVGNVWSATPSGTVYQAFEGDSVLSMARYPKMVDDYANSANYFQVTSSSTTTSFICEDLIGFTDFTGGTVQLFTDLWDITANVVTAFNPATGLVTLTDAVTITPGANFFITNHISFLDSENEWIYDSGQLKIYSTTIPSNISGNTLTGDGISISSSDYITIDNLSIKGYTVNGIDALNSDNLSIVNSNVEYCLDRAITTKGSANTLVDNNYIKGSRFGININNYDPATTESNAVITNNTVYEIGMAKQSTNADIGIPHALEVFSKGNTVRGNVIEKSGNNGIRFWGQNTLVEKNHVKHFSLTSEDAGAIYSYAGALPTDTWLTTTTDGSIVRDNIVESYDLGDWASNGIYFDSQSKNIDCYDNTVIGGYFSVMLHNNRNINLYNNKIYDPYLYGIRFNEDSQGGDGATYGNTINNNEVFIKKQSSSALRVKSSYDNWDFATYTNNKYFNPYSFMSTSVRGTSGSTTYRTLGEWKIFSSQDATSVEDNLEWYPFEVVSYDSATLVTNGDGSSGTTGWNGVFCPVTNEGGYIRGTASAALGKLRGSAFTTTIGKSYVVEFDMLETNQRQITVRIITTSGGYRTIKSIPLYATGTWEKYAFYYTPTETLTDTQVEWESVDIGDQTNIDNLVVREATLQDITVRDTVVYNETSIAKDVILPSGTWVTLDGNNYEGTINIPAYSSEILTKLVPTYTVSNTDGTADYASLTTLLATETLVAGDVVALKGGDEFYENATLSSVSGTSGSPITFTSYGTGKAVIKGSEAVTGWTDLTGNIWSKAIATPVYQVFDSNGNALQNAKSAEFVIDTAPTTSTFTCSSLDGRTDLVGATVFFRKYTWYQSSATITAFDDATDLVTIDAGSLPTYGFEPGTFINIVNAADDLAVGTWRYDSGTLYVGSVGEPTGVRQSSNTTTGIALTTSDYIIIDNLEIRDFNTDAISTIDCNYITIKNNLLKNNYEHGVAANVTLGPYNSVAGTQIDILNNEISGSMYEGMRNYAVGSSMSNNIIHTIGTTELYTYLRSASSRALVSSGDNQTMSNNSLTNIGYNGISFTGQNALIEYNFIDDFCNFLYDGGAIYTYTGATGGAPNLPHKGANSTVQYNTIIGSEVHKNRTIAAIYLDDVSKDITLSNNSISTTARGIYLHNTATCTIDSNVIYNTTFGIRIGEDSNWGNGEVTGNIITNNEVYIESNYIDPVYGQKDAAFFMSSIYDNINLYTGANNKYFNNGDQSPTQVLSSSIWFQTAGQFAKPHTVSELQTLTGTETGTVQNTTWNNQPFAYSNAGANLISNSDFSAGTSGWFGGVGTLSDGGGYANFIPTAATTNGYVTVLGDGWISVTEGDYYLVEFDIQSTGADHIIRVALNQATTPYPGMEIRPVNTTSNWVSHKYLYYADFTSTEVRLEFMERSTDIGFNLDNISLKKVNKETYTLDNSFFAYNETSAAKEVALPTGTWQLMSDGTTRTGSITLQPFTSEILIKQ